MGVHRRVLCVGDSNTYGLRLADRNDAYPQQLERLWNSAPERQPIEILNLGYPGTNSSKLVHDLPRMLDTLRPDVVIIMVGANDYWTAPVTESDEVGAHSRVALLTERYSRLFQLMYMIGRAFDHRQLEVTDAPSADEGSRGSARFGDVEFSFGWRKKIRPGVEVYADLVANLRRLADLVRSSGAEPIFLTYASAMWNYGDASNALRQVATASGVRLIDAAVPMAAVCAAEPCAEWLYTDHHPTAAGYRLIAEHVVRALADGT